MIGNTYVDIINSIELTSKSHPFVNTFFYGDIYNTLNPASDTDYPCIVLTNNINTMSVDISTYSFNIFFVDRLTSSRDNKLNVQGLGIETIKEILNALMNHFGLIVDFPANITLFEESFPDLCAGCFASFTVASPNRFSNCDFLTVCKCKSDE